MPSLTDDKRVVHIERWIPRNDRDLWAECVRQLLPRVGIEAREADLERRRCHARLLAIAALREAGEDRLADSLAHRK